MKRKELAEQYLRTYIAYTLATPYNSKPEKGVNSGAAGRCFELAVKYMFSNFRGMRIAAPGRYDTLKKVGAAWETFEMKTGAGELAVLDENGKIIRSCMKSNYIIYAPVFYPDSFVGLQAYVLPMKTFLKVLYETGLVRTKKSTQMVKKPKELQYPDRLAIQTFSTSQKKTDALFDALEKYGERLDKWAAKNMVPNK